MFMRRMTAMAMVLGTMVLGTMVLCAEVAQAGDAKGPWDGKIMDVAGETVLSLDELALRLQSSRLIVLGEKHYSVPVQKAQATVLEAVVRRGGAESRFTTAWEFLNVTSQPTTGNAFARFVAGEIDVLSLLKILQGSAGAPTYAPILEATKALGGELLGVNLSRAEKAPVVERGIGAVDPALLPPGFEMGSEGYFERFRQAMEGHATPEQIRNYYAAQCLTDDVMAYHLLKDSAAPLKFLVVGSFHSDYSDGVVSRLRARAPRVTTKAVRFIDAADYTEAELAQVQRDAQYGDIAEFVYFVNEPASP